MSEDQKREKPCGVGHSHLPEDIIGYEDLLPLLPSATPFATPNTLVMRDENGEAKLKGIQVELEAGKTFDVAVGGFSHFNANAFGGSIGNNTLTWSYNNGGPTNFYMTDSLSMASFRAALGSGTTGDALFTSNTPLAAADILKAGLAEHEWLPKGHSGIFNYVLEAGNFIAVSNSGSGSQNIDGLTWAMDTGSTANSHARSRRVAPSSLVPFGNSGTGGITFAMNNYRTKFSTEILATQTAAGVRYRNMLTPSTDPAAGLVASFGYGFSLFTTSGTNADLRVFGIPSTLASGSTPAITGATNASPIVVTTATAHGLSSGDWADIVGVLGNSAADGVRQVTVLSATTFSLNGSVGSGAYTSGGNYMQTTPVLSNVNILSRNNQVCCYTTPRSSTTYDVTIWLNGFQIGTSPLFFSLAINVNQIINVSNSSAARARFLTARTELGWRV